MNTTLKIAKGPALFPDVAALPVHVGTFAWPASLPVQGRVSNGCVGTGLRPVQAERKLGCFWGGRGFSRAAKVLLVYSPSERRARKEFPLNSPGHRTRLG